MSRSRKKTPIAGITAASSEKSDKQASHRKIRRRVRQLPVESGELVLPLERQLTNPWTMSKDGKLYFDPAKHPKEMRK
jgi:hypothetical protein